MKMFVAVRRADKEKWNKAKSPGHVRVHSYKRGWERQRGRSQHQTHELPTSFSQIDVPSISHPASSDSWLVIISTAPTRETREHWFYKFPTSRMKLVHVFTRQTSDISWCRLLSRVVTHCSSWRWEIGTWCTRGQMDKWFLSSFPYISDV